MMLPNTTNTGETHPGRTPNLMYVTVQFSFHCQELKRRQQELPNFGFMTIQTISVTTSHRLRVFCAATPLILIVHPTCVMEDEVSIYLKLYVKFYLLFYYFNIH
ncbi:unnamed protein product [Musa hybrid cultivar]